MSAVDWLEIELEPGPWQGDEYIDAWPVAGRIRGHLRCRPGDDIRCRGVRVALGWRTEGRGSTDKKTVDEVAVHDGPLLAGLEHDWPFELHIPEGPISYDGHLIRIVWEVVATVSIRLRRDPESRYTISVLPDYVAG